MVLKTAGNGIAQGTCLWHRSPWYLLCWAPEQAFLVSVPEVLISDPSLSWSPASKPTPAFHLPSVSTWPVTGMAANGSCEMGSIQDRGNLAHRPEPRSLKTKQCSETSSEWQWWWGAEWLKVIWGQEVLDISVHMIRQSRVWWAWPLEVYKMQPPPFCFSLPITQWD